VGNRLLLVDFLFHDTVLVHTNGSQDIQHRLIRSLSFGHDVQLPKRTLSIGSSPSTMSATVIFCQAGVPSSACFLQYLDCFVLQMSRILSMTPGPYRTVNDVIQEPHMAKRTMQGTGIKNLVFVVTRNGDEKLGLTASVGDAQTPAVFLGKLVGVASGGGVPHVRELV
jgi:hypothetical protein